MKLKEKIAQLYLRHKNFNIANLAPIFSDARSGTIADKNQKRITAGTHLGDLFKYPAFLEPACDGQHGYRVLLVSVCSEKNICF